MAVPVPSLNLMINNLSLSSLEDIAMLATVKNFMSKDDVQEIFCLHFLPDKPSLTLFSNEVAKIIQACTSHVPEIFENKLLCTIHWIKDQYFNWINFIMTELPFPDKIYYFDFYDKKSFIKYVINSIIWDLNETINYRLSLLKFMKCLKDVDCVKSIKLLFQIAAKFCLEDDLRFFWAKMSEKTKKSFLVKRLDLDDGTWSETFDRRHPYHYFTYYWACMISGEVKNFEEEISKYMSKEGFYYYEACRRGGLNKANANEYFFIYSVFDKKGVYDGVKFFFEKSLCDIEDIVTVYIKNFERDEFSEFKYAQVLYFLLRKIDNNEFLERIFNKWKAVFLESSLSHWPLHKFLVQFVKMSPDLMTNGIFFYLVRSIIESVQSRTMDSLILKDIWNNVSIDVKESFCKGICGGRKKFWGEYVTVDILSLLLKEEKLKEILTPWKNERVLELINVQKYEVIDYWLEKCLGNEEAIVAFMEDFIVKKTVDVVNNMFPKWILKRFNRFLEWCFKYEDKMNKDDIFKVKDKIVEDVGMEVMIRGIEGKKWEELEKFLDWVLKNRNCYYEEKLIDLKIEAIQEIFESSQLKFLKEYNFEKSFNKFLEYGVSNIEKLKVGMSEINFYESEYCSEWLKDGNWELIDPFLKFSAKYEKDILKMKEKILLYILSNGLDSFVSCFKSEEFCLNIKKLLYWNSNMDPDIRKKIWEIKKLVIEKYGLESIIKCMREGSHDVFDNIMEFLFKDNKSENIGKIIFDLKIQIIDKLMNDESFWKKRKYLSMMINLINYGKNDENLVKENWDVKKYFIEQLKKNVKVKMIPDLIISKNINYISLIFKDHTDENDFKNVLWDFKEYLLKEIVDDNNYMLIRPLFENFEEFEQFLNWNGFNQTELMNLKELILDEKMTSLWWHCIVEINESKLEKILNWFFSNDSSSNFDLKLLELQKSTLFTLCTKSVFWEFKILWSIYRFSSFYHSDELLEYKHSIVEQYSVADCCKLLSKGDFNKVKDFLDWAFDDNKKPVNELIYNFKKKMIEEVLNIKNIDYYWKKQKNILNQDQYEFRVALNQLVYEFECHNCVDNEIQDQDPMRISNMKLDAIEKNYAAIFEKFLTEAKPVHLKNFLAWAFDSRMNSDEILYRVNKLKKEIFDKFGINYCAVLLRGNDLEGVKEFLAQIFRRVQGANVKLVLWDVKKKCINQLLVNILNENKDKSDEGDFYKSLNKFLVWGPLSINIKNEIINLKKNVKQQYALNIIKNYCKEVSNRQISEPIYFLTWLFGSGKSNFWDNLYRCDELCEKALSLDEKELLDFNKDIIEALFNLEYEEVMCTRNFYNFVKEILAFHDEFSHIRNSNKSLVKLLAVKLCIDLICHNNVNAFEEALNWLVVVIYDFDSNYDFRRSLIIELAGNLNLVYKFECLKSILVYCWDEMRKEEVLAFRNSIFETYGVDICYNWVLKNQWDDICDFLKFNLEPLTREKLMEFKNRFFEKYKMDLKFCNNFTLI